MFIVFKSVIQYITMMIQSRLCIYCIQLLIYVKVFEHTVILKYYKCYLRFYMFYLIIFFKVFNVINVLKIQRRASRPSLIITAHKLSRHNILFMELGEVFFIGLQVIVKNIFDSIHIVDDRVEQKALQGFFVTTFNNCVNRQLRDHQFPAA